MLWSQELHALPSSISRQTKVYSSVQNISDVANVDHADKNCQNLPTSLKKLIKTTLHCINNCHSLFSIVLYLGTPPVVWSRDPRSNSRLYYFVAKPHRTLTSQPFPAFSLQLGFSVSIKYELGVLISYR